ncbi:unnamed protein product [Cylindrotheca closterium]|uniref:Uncharacterized protein n=1 Tax=Cylindrotheca closterium TaxID=2856 RepID=A0AAD2FYB3_9STRA|nr:unnamed protein product [Cylindrotheca closterium]
MMTRVLPTNSEITSFPQPEDSLARDTTPENLLSQITSPEAHRKDSGDFTDTSGSSDGSIGSKKSVNSTDVWVQACEAHKDDPSSTPNAVAAETIGQPHTSTASSEATQKALDDRQQDQQPLTTADAEEGESSVDQQWYEDESTDLNSSSTFQKTNMDSRISSVTFTTGSVAPQSSSELFAPSINNETETPQTSSEFLKASGNKVVSRDITNSERWKNNNKSQLPQPASRKISFAPKQGDFGLPSIPKRTSLNSNNSYASSAAATTVWPTKAILKASVDEVIPVKIHRRFWKKLPPPEMNIIKEKRQQMLDFLQSQEEEKENKEVDVPSSTTATTPFPPPTGIHHRSQSDCTGTPAVALAPLRERSKSEGAKANVNFESIFVREYQQTIGDNPSVGYGTAISLDWPYIDHDPVDLDVYETKKKRRTMRQMFLNHYQRKNILIHRYGHSPEEVKAAKRATNKVKTQREISKMMQTSLQPLLLFEEMRESAVRKVKRRRNKGKNRSSDVAIVSSGEMLVHE